MKSIIYAFIYVLIFCGASVILGCGGGGSDNPTSTKPEVSTTNGGQPNDGLSNGATNPTPTDPTLITPTITAITDPTTPTTDPSIGANSTDSTNGGETGDQPTDQAGNGTDNQETTPDTDQDQTVELPQIQPDPLFDFSTKQTELLDSLKLIVVNVTETTEPDVQEKRKSKYIHQRKLSKIPDKFKTESSVDFCGACYVFISETRAAIAWKFFTVIDKNIFAGYFLAFYDDKGNNSFSLDEKSGLSLISLSAVSFHPSELEDYLEITWFDIIESYFPVEEWEELYPDPEIAIPDEVVKEGIKNILSKTNFYRITIFGSIVLKDGAREWIIKDKQEYSLYSGLFGDQIGYFNSVLGLSVYSPESLLNEISWDQVPSENNFWLMANFLTENYGSGFSDLLNKPFGSLLTSINHDQNITRDQSIIRSLPKIF